VSEGAEVIVDAILSMAKKRAEEIIEEAKKEAERIIEEAKKEAERIMMAKREKAEREAMEEVMRRKSVAEIEAKKILMGAKKDIIREIEAKVEEELAKISEGVGGINYEEVLERYIREGINVLGSRIVYVACRDKDREIVRKISERISRETGVDIRLDDKNIQSLGGVIMRNEDDSIRFYGTFEGRIRDYFDRNQRRILDMILGGG
jgi:V/A-type H+-transporting ATPase subunit E